MAERFDLDAIDADDALLDLLAAGGEQARSAGEQDAAVRLLADLRLAVEVEDELPEERIDDPESFLARCAALNPVTDPFARKMATRGLALGVAAVAALSVSGVAAAVNGDPLSPYEKVIEKVVDAVSPQTSFPKEQLDGMPVVDKTKIVKVAKDFQKKQAAKDEAEQKAVDSDAVPPAAVVAKEVVPDALQRVVPPIEHPTVTELAPPPVQATQVPDGKTDDTTATDQPTDGVTTDDPTSNPTSDPTGDPTGNPTGDPTEPPASSDPTTAPPTDPPATTEPTAPVTDPPSTPAEGSDQGGGTGSTGETGGPTTTAPTDGSDNGSDGGSDNGGSTGETQPGSDDGSSSQPGDDTGLNPGGTDQSGTDQTGSDQTGTDQIGAGQTGGDQSGSDQAGDSHQVQPIDPRDALGALAKKVSPVLPTPTGGPIQLESAKEFFSAKHSSGKTVTGSVRKDYTKGKHSSGQYPEGKHAAIARTHGSTADAHVLRILGVVNKPLK